MHVGAEQIRCVLYRIFRVILSEHMIKSNSAIGVFKKVLEAESLAAGEGGRSHRLGRLRQIDTFASTFSAQSDVKGPTCSSEAFRTVRICQAFCGGP
jgi:hypothetical protein